MKVCLFTFDVSPIAQRSRLSQGKAAPELSSVTETNQVADSPSPKSPKAVETDPHASTRQLPQTPTAPRIEPSREEMHPSLYHTSTMPEPSSALRLGFTDVRPGTVNGPAAAQGTPTRTTSRVPSSEFTFRFAQGAAQAPLSENAQRLMNELREQANKIKVEMRAQREAEGDVADRKIAQPKGKASRFSAAHMAEFKKMDSIENHASAWRANRTPPVTNTSELKHSASKSSLQATPTAVKPSLKRSLSKANLDGTPQSKPKSALKRSSSRAKLDDGEFKQPDTPNFSVAGKPRTMPVDEPKSSFAKRIKKFQEEDTSMSRPISRDGSTIPRPTSSGKGLNKSQSTSSFARLASPTKASLGHSSTPTKSTISLVKSPSRSELVGPSKSSSTSNLATTASASRTAELRRRIISPGRFQKVKSILRGQKSLPNEEARTALPKPALQMSKTPGPTRVTDKELPPLPLTTPRRKLVKHVAFTPDTKHAAEQQDTPSPQKFTQKTNVPTIQYPTLDGVLAQSAQSAQDKEVAYPDLSPLRDITDVHDDKRKSLPKSVPGTFSFRSDHTIDFGTASPSGFGASPGQASLRQVRTSSAPKGMPGAFPTVPEPSTHPNKENAAPTPNRKGISHGLSNKKRHRAPSEEGDVDREGEERGGKKQKSTHGTPAKASMAPRLTSTPVSSIKKMAPGRTPSKTPGSATPSKKKGGLSISRLNMLARPKQRT